MQRLYKIAVFTTIVTASLADNQAVRAAELVSNGSFETGTFLGWNQSGSITLVGAPPATNGSLSAALSFGNQPNNGVLSQSLDTEIGQSYELSFDFGTNGLPNIEQLLQVEVTGSNGALIRETLSAQGPPIEFNPFIFNFVADSTTTELLFADRSTATAGIDIQLDNVSVTSAGELVNNGSFEKGNFSGWTQSGSANIVAVPPAAKGVLSAALSFGNQPNNGVLFQDLDTEIGQSYELSFDFGTNGLPNIEQLLQVEVTGSNGALINETLSAQGPPIEFNPFTFNFVADSTTTRLQFADRSIATAGIDIQLDNVSVEALAISPPNPPAEIPTPALLPGLIGMGVTALRKRASE